MSGVGIVHRVMIKFTLLLERFFSFAVGKSLSLEQRKNIIIIIIIIAKAVN